MQTYRLIVDADGRVRVPDGKPGQIVTVRLEPTPEQVETAPLTLATARTDAERDAVIADIRRTAREIRAELPEPWLSGDHGDLLYDDQGFPT